MHSINPVCLLKDNISSKRVSSYSRTGGNDDYIRVEAHQTMDFAIIEGAGIIKHIWITLSCEDQMIRRNAIIRMYWDGETNPSVESPLGDFFGQGWGEEYTLNTLLLAASPAKGKALNSYFNMPYGNGARIEIENQSEFPITNLYFYVDYEVHQKIDESIGRFHAWWNRKITESFPVEGETEWGIVGSQGNNVTDEHNFLLAELEGKGHIIGINYFVDNPGPMWYGEGDDMWLIDGEAWPGSMHGTGTEDFFNSAWCPNEIYMHPYFGYAKVPSSIGWMGRTHCYRFFIEDPIIFSKSIRGSIESGHDNNLTLDLSSVVYWYQAEPHKVFTPFPTIDKRQNMPRISVGDIHFWRNEYRKAHGFQNNLWGSEWRDK